MSDGRNLIKTNIPWCDKIPDNWAIVPFFTQFDERNVKNLDERESTVLSLSYGKIKVRDVSTNFGLLPDSFSTYQIIYPDDIIIRPTDMQNDHVSLRIGRVRQKGIITSAYICLVPKNIDPAFAHQLLHGYDLMKIFYQIGGGVRHSLKFEDIKRLELPLPPIHEQKAIAEFLDRKTAEIDELIEKKQRLIELLKEERQAIINQAVTRGIDPNVKLKPSGIEWLGEIPEDWNLKKVKYVADVYGGSTPYTSNPVFWDGDIVWVTPKDISEISTNYIFDSQRKITYKGVVNAGLSKLQKNSIVLTTRAPIGNLALAGTELTTNQGCKTITIVKGDPVFFFYQFQQFNEIFQALGTGTTFKELSSDVLKNTYLVVPPFHEQTKIVEYIESKDKIAGQTINKIIKEIDLIKEFRTALISEAVTGKIKVV